MLIAASIIPINALLNYGFIYGHFGLTELGGVGCGKATAIVWWLQLALMIVVINRPFFKITNFFNVNPRPRPVMAKQLFTIGQPIGLSVFLEMAIFSVISFLVAAISVQEVAANSIAFNLNWLTFVIPMSFGTAAGIRIGYHVGARELKLAGDAAAAAGGERRRRSAGLDHGDQGQEEEGRPFQPRARAAAAQVRERSPP